jgi:hypothetical protein
MQSLKFKDKVKKKVKEFLAVTLISSSILVSNVSCDNKEEDIYGDHPIVDVEQTDKDTTNVNDKDVLPVIDNDKDNLIDDENSDLDLTDEDELLNDEETDEDVDDENEEEIPDEDPLPINTGSKYVPSSDEIEKEYEKDCFDYVKLAKLIGAYCESSDKIDIETPSGKCYVPFYMTGNSPFQGTSSCKVHILFLGIEGSIKQGSYKPNREIFNNKVILLNKYLVYSYIMHKYLKEEDIRKVITYPYDNMDEKHLIPNYNNSFEYNEVPYKMLNEHLDVLHEMEFINELNNKHTRYKFSTLWLYNLNGFPFVPLDLMKCPIEDKEASLAVLGFLPNNSIVTNDPKYQKHINGECDEYYMERTQELIDEIEGN